MRWWIAAAAACLVIAVGLPIGVCICYTRQYARHSCQALDVLTARPVPRPVDPRANPSREQVYRLYQGLEVWARADGCK